MKLEMIPYAHIYNDIIDMSENFVNKTMNFRFIDCVKLYEII